MNKKIRNATPTCEDGIQFRSQLERRIYKYLVQAGYIPLYEPDTIELCGPFRPSEPWYYEGEAQVTKSGLSKTVLKMTYTPDFRLDVNGVTFYIEAKGKENDSFPIKRKLFLSWIEKQDRHIVFAEIKTIKGLQKLLKRIESL